jgi:hypothetical protein
MSSSSSGGSFAQRVAAYRTPPVCVEEGDRRRVQACPTWIRRGRKTPVDVAADALKVALGYELGYRFRESVVPDENIQEAILAEYGTAEAFRDAAVIGHAGTPPLDDLPDGALPADAIGGEYRPEDEPDGWSMLR